MHRDVRKSAPHRPAPRSTDDHAPLPPVPTHPAGAGAGSAPDGGGGGVTSAVGARTSDPVPTLVLVLHHAAKTPHSSQALGLRIERPG
jgi:hypothetical protein